MGARRGFTGILRHGRSGVLWGEHQRGADGVIIKWMARFWRSMNLKSYWVQVGFGEWFEALLLKAMEERFTALSTEHCTAPYDLCRDKLPPSL